MCSTARSQNLCSERIFFDGCAMLSLTATESSMRFSRLFLYLSYASRYIYMWIFKQYLYSKGRLTRVCVVLLQKSLVFKLEEILTSKKIVHGSIYRDEHDSAIYISTTDHFGRYAPCLPPNIYHAAALQHHSNSKVSRSKLLWITSYVDEIKVPKKSLQWSAFHVDSIFNVKKHIISSQMDLCWFQVETNAKRDNVFERQGFTHATNILLKRSCHLTTRRSVFLLGACHAVAGELAPVELLSFPLTLPKKRSVEGSNDSSVLC